MQRNILAISLTEKWGIIKYKMRKLQLNNIRLIYVNLDIMSTYEINLLSPATYNILRN